MIRGSTVGGLTGADTPDAGREVRRPQTAVSAGGSDAGPSMRARSFPPGLDSVRAARHFVTGLLGGQADNALASDVAIVATELAANAVLHARSGFTLSVARSATAVRIGVRDGDPLDGGPFDVRRGHGLSVVAQLATGWAVEPLPDGKVVWADLPWRAS